MTSTVKRRDSRRKKSIFSFGDEDDDDDQHGFVLEPLSKQVVDRAAFTAPEFDPDRFLSSRRHLGLERLKVELNSHLKFLKAELVELINRDYQDFINLSTNLKGVDKAIDQVKRPLRRMESQVQDVRGHCQQTIDRLEEQLAYRGKLREQKTCLKLLLNIHESVTKVEDLLGINRDDTAAGAVVVDDTDPALTEEGLGKQIDRVAIEFNQMQHLVGRGKDLPFMKENEWRITRIKNTLQNKLSKTLTDALHEMQPGQTTSSTKQSLVQCLRTYALIDQTQVAEWLIREQFVRPFVANTVNKKALSGRHNGHAVDQLTAMYNKLLSFATTSLQPILEITQKTLKGTSYEVLVNSFWVEVVERINAECSSIYAPGQTNIFHKNYSATVSFISGIEALCSNKKSLLYLRSHQRYAEFMKRWQLPVYFQLRFREIVNGVEDLLNDPKASIATDDLNKPGDKGLALAATRAVSNAIEQCWSDHVFLYGLSHRFWKLTLQLLRRYNLWASNVLQHLLETSAGTDKSNNNQGADSSNKSDAKQNDETGVLLRLVILSHDVEGLIHESKDYATKIIIPKLPNSVQQDLPLIRESMDGILQELERSTATEIQHRIIHVISQRCIESLELVTGIIKQYRHTNRQPPTEPSSLIPSLFNPYTTFVKQNAAWIDEEKSVAWGYMIADAVITRYTAVMTEQLTKMRKMEDSLKRLKKGKKSSRMTSSGGQSGGMTDEDKIQLQFLLDVRQLKHELTAMKIDTEKFKPYRKLYEVVKPFEQLVGNTLL
ncbi:oligomeric golgi complex component, COG2-domain-containing protein [Zychaea mexicana]|uniref:oligomeric golgi complex component, COG2-domain-containing protein n=1 Tax=Zychaea mexicana TaxID=64656 RepID=UPI0022FE5E2B|nr:oligomeric golgi complex component, COG2-domain-containing protein [Zychaea mexicana]KAI9484960.1 oligomeric golgi complex component, COG2-domain-containing protein [Zychaea mexicana]